ncbi:hypothetical protein FJV41_07265 [Myxococcus llanfairpwllgwyngyllgogerychwyrndrobwllllantysiliogogogochensis]|uniref:Lipoprotein n=2 Tax=Myxococcus llanfairpwllgwyngyllgogerychwyrndrobwllllantysiliogogogochensis TaxID=2590453 RepID=A0A540X5S8_9BACT|nr:hypothetical protein FJV41_07265 [Myxococcus llanfairpwllgwyngyllgogerychwyrndrobwllllantysiliogogogochensis]
MRALLQAGACCMALAIIVGCTRASNQPAHPGGRVAHAQVELKVESVTSGPEGLAVAYAVRNASSHAVLLVDGLPEWGPTGYVGLAPERAYVDLSGDGAVLLRQLVPVPENLDVEAPEVPALSRVEPGTTASRRLLVPLPLRTSMPYATGPEVTRELSAVRELRLRVGYLPAADDVRLHGATESGGTAYRTAEYGQVVTRQQVLDSGPLPLDGVK